MAKVSGLAQTHSFSDGGMMAAFARLPSCSAHKPVLIAGPTASGKSALALHIAQTQGGQIINADALQVFDGWRILTARPSINDLSKAPHALYGHVPFDAEYSVGAWLKDIVPLISDGPRPIIVGGTGLYFNALTKGLAPIPPTPIDLRKTADSLSLAELLAGVDAQTTLSIDTNNRARVQRAWEVQQSTGRSISDWQADTPPPILPMTDVLGLVLRPDPDWLNTRIVARFDQMLDQGALEEARDMQASWNPAHLSSKAIGASDLIAVLRSEISLDQARQAAIIGSRQYAKRQRTWLRSHMEEWTSIALG